MSLLVPVGGFGVILRPVGGFGVILRPVGGFGPLMVRVGGFWSTNGPRRRLWSVVVVSVGVVVGGGGQRRCCGQFRHFCVTLGSQPLNFVIFSKTEKIRVLGQNCEYPGFRSKLRISGF